MRSDTHTSSDEKLIDLQIPDFGKSVIISHDAASCLRLGFEPHQSRISIEGNDLIFRFPDRGFIRVRSFFDEGKEPPSIVMADGSPILVQDLIGDAAQELDTLKHDNHSYDPEMSTGLPEYRDDPGTLVDGVGRSGMLETFYWGQETDPDEWYQGDWLRAHGDTQSGPSLAPGLGAGNVVRPTPGPGAGSGGGDVQEPQPGPGPGGEGGQGAGPDINPGTGDGQEPEPGPLVLEGVFRLNLVMHEDAQPLKHTLLNPDNPGSLGNSTLEHGYDPAAGMTIRCTLDDQPCGQPSGVSGTGDEIYLHSFTVTSLPDPACGTVYYNGVPLETGQTIGLPDMNGFSFMPAPHFSGSPEMGFTYVLCTDNTGPASNVLEGGAVFVVDSVADLASASSEATGGTTQAGEMAVEEAVIANGWAEQAVEAESAVEITFIVTAQFYDLDGSETAWIEIALPTGFSIPEGLGMVLVENEQGRFAKILMPDMTTLAAAEGIIETPVTLIMDGTAQVGEKSLSIKVCTLEMDALSTGGFSTDNNLAERTISQEVEVDLLPGAFAVKAGWAYEGNKSGGTATDDVTTIGLDSDSTTAGGAPVVFSLENGSFSGGLITIDPALGALYHNSARLTPGEDGEYILDSNHLNSGTLYFVPAGHLDGDVSMEYSLVAEMGNGSVFTLSGKTVLAVDAVADVAVVDDISSVADSEDPASMIVAVEAAFADADSSENHYILVEWKEGWTSPDAHELVTVCLDADENPMQPTGYLLDGSGYAYEGAASVKQYFRFDVTEESLGQAKGETYEYSLRLSPPTGASNTELTILTMAEEKAGGLSGLEYDVANNVAWTSDGVSLDLADAALTMTATEAYENHCPEQHEGETNPVETGGFITVALENNGDTINVSEGREIVLTFTYDGPTGSNGPGTFTWGDPSQTCSLSDANYTFVSGTDNKYQVTIDLGQSGLASGSTSFTLRYNPPENDDTDLTGLSISVPVISGSGHTGSSLATLARLTVDAVANLPESLALEPKLPPGYTAAFSGGIIDLGVSVQFDDYVDGSEQHYLVFDLDSGLASIAVGSFPEGSCVQLTPEQVGEAGLSYTDGGRYVVIRVANSYLQEHDGLFSATIKAGLDEVETNTTLDLKFLAVSADTPSDSGETRTDNNIAVEYISENIQVNAITSDVELSAGQAFENGISHAHIGGETVNGAGSISLDGLAQGELLISMTISWSPEDGGLLYQGQPIEAGDTVIGGTTLRYDPEAGTLQIFSTNGESCVASDVNLLSFLPAHNHSDEDVPLGYSCIVLDEASGMSHGFTAKEPVMVEVDAVAQNPADASASVSYGDEQAAGAVATVTAEATFRDTADGSEKHYLIFEYKYYFNLAELPDRGIVSLISVGFDAEGDTLSPSTAPGNFLNPNLDEDTTASTSGGRVTFFQICVDDAIALHDPEGETAQTFNGFTVTLSTDGSYTVSYTMDIPIFQGGLWNGDVIGEKLLVGGMSQETATPAAGDQGGGEEAYYYNNTAYDLAETTISVAMVETGNVDILTGWAYERNTPEANLAADAPQANGAGILAVRTASGSGEYASEQLTITITYDALYQDDDGEWVLPGTIVYDFDGGAEPIMTVNEDTGEVTVIVTISTEDTASVIMSGAVSKDYGTRADQVDESHIRFIPGDNHNEADVNLRYSVEVTETLTGETKDVGAGTSAVAIDAVADKPVISDVRWGYGDSGNGDYIAFADEKVVLSLVVEFPDDGTDGAISEGQYILVKQNTDMDLSPEFIAAVESTGFSVENYVIVGDSSPYYRIPVAFFDRIQGTNTYNVSISMVMEATANIAEGAFSPDLAVLALAIVESTSGREPDTSNNSAFEQADIPGLDFAFISTSVEGGRSHVYEGDAPRAHLGDHTPGEGVTFSLGLRVGDSPAGDRKEQVSDIKFTYDESHGTLAYHDGNEWVNVRADGGLVPPEYSDSLRYIPKDVRDSSADLDQELRYSFTVTEPASGAEKTIDGTYTIIVDAVAEQPTVTEARINAYIGDDPYVKPDGGFDLRVSANFPDHDKNGQDHSDHYILVQVPGEGWEVWFTSPVSAADLYIKDGVSYFRFPVTTVDAQGNASMTVFLTAPGEGQLIYGNAEPLKVGALSVARDPNKDSQPAGDEEWTYDNNWAHSDTVGVTINYTAPEGFFSISPLYENNNPRGNELDPDGEQPVQEESGGKVNLAAEVNGETIESVRLTWDTTMGDLYVNGDKVDPQIIDGTKGYRDIPASDFEDVYFRVTAPNSDADWDPVTAEAFGSGNSSLGSDSWKPVVDAVAHVPTHLESEPGYNEEGAGTGYTAAIPGEEVDIVVSAVFHDLEGGSERFMLVEAHPDWSLPEGVSYAVITAPDGKAYFQIPVPDGKVDPQTGECRMEITLITPPGIGASGVASHELATGAMTVREPGDEEYRSDNNVSYNLTGSVTVTTAVVVSSPLLEVTDTYAATDSTGDGTGDPGLSARLFVTGMEESDSISEIRLTYSTENGDVTYEGVSLTQGGFPDVAVTGNLGGMITLTITNTDIINALVAGNAEDSAVLYVPETHNDADEPVSAEFDVCSRLSPDTMTTDNGTSIIVDAVALQPRDVGMSYADDYSGACGPGESVDFTVTATFMDMNNPNAQHNLAIQNLGAWTFEGTLPPEISIQTYDGVSYYVLNVEAALQSNSQYLVSHSGGTYGFTLPLTAPTTFSGDAVGAADILGGAVVVVTPRDNEVSYDNNTAVKTDSLSIDVGVVTTEAVNFRIAPVEEGSASGSAITINSSNWNSLTTGNERVTDTLFTFKGDFADLSPGTQIGTIRYGGSAEYAIAVGTDGTASAQVSFGSGGFDPDLSFLLVWGSVASGDGMTVETSSTVVDNASEAVASGVGGSGSVDWVPIVAPLIGMEGKGLTDHVGLEPEALFSATGTFEDAGDSEIDVSLVEQLEEATNSFMAESGENLAMLGGLLLFEQMEKIPVPPQSDATGIDPASMAGDWHPPQHSSLPGGDAGAFALDDSFFSGPGIPETGFLLEETATCLDDILPGGCGLAPENTESHAVQTAPLDAVSLPPDNGTISPEEFLIMTGCLS